MDPSNYVAQFKQLVDGAGIDVSCNSILLREVAAIAEWYCYRERYVKVSDGFYMTVIPLSDARKLVELAEKNIAEAVFKALAP